MSDVIWALLPIVLGVIASPVAVMTLIGVLLSDDARRNGVAYLVGWVGATVASLLAWYALFEALDARGDREPAPWVRVLHLVLALGFAVGAVITYRRARGVMDRLAAAQTPDEIVEATPQLPSRLRSATKFRPRRALRVGFTVFLFNPLNISLVAAAALEISSSDAQPWHRIWLVFGFTAAAVLPVAAPVAVLFARRDRADAMLEQLRSWIVRHNGAVSAVVLLVVAVFQLVKAVDGVLW